MFKQRGFYLISATGLYWSGSAWTSKQEEAKPFSADIPDSGDPWEAAADTRAKGVPCVVVHGIPDPPRRKRRAYLLPHFAHADTNAIPAEAPPEVDVNTLSRWFGVRSGQIRNWVKAGILPQPVRYGYRKIRYRTDEVRKTVGAYAAAVDEMKALAAQLVSLKERQIDVYNSIADPSRRLCNLLEEWKYLKSKRRVVEYELEHPEELGFSGPVEALAYAQAQQQIQDAATGAENGGDQSETRCSETYQAGDTERA